PFVLTQLMSWTVLVWELSFPLLVLVRWTRPIALLFGVAFHLGIFATLELGGFGPYMLVLYLPLLPWDRWLEKRARQAAGVAGLRPGDRVRGLPEREPAAAKGGARWGGRVRTCRLGPRSASAGPGWPRRAAPSQRPSRSGARRGRAGNRTECAPSGR